MDFKTDVDVSLFDYEITTPSGEKKVARYLHGRAVVSWALEIEARSWGVKGMYVIIPDQVIAAEVEIDDENGDAQPMTIDLDVKKVLVNFQAADGIVTPSEIMFHKGEWEVS